MIKFIMLLVALIGAFTGGIYYGAKLESVTPVLLDDERGPPIHCGRPCVITGSTGGSIVKFRVQGLALQAHQVPVIVDGFCASACTLLIDEDRANVCITTSVLLAYHQANYKDERGVVHYQSLSYETPGLNAYLASRGGLPKQDVLLVTFEQAKQFYQPCKGAT